MTPGAMLKAFFRNLFRRRQKVYEHDAAVWVTSNSVTFARGRPTSLADRLTIDQNGDIRSLIRGKVVNRPNPTPSTDEN